MILKPTKKEYKELKDFKLKVSLAIHNARILKQYYPEQIPYIVVIHGVTFTLNPSLWETLWNTSEVETERMLKKFTTSVW